jgi:hypothetical protein
MLQRFRRDDATMIRVIGHAHGSPTTQPAAELNAAADLANTTSGVFLPLLHRIDPAIAIPSN